MLTKIKTLKNVKKRDRNKNKKAQLSLTNLRDAKACQKLLHSTCLHVVADNTGLSSFV